MASSRPDAGKGGTTHVMFICHRCNQPLKLDSSFNELDKAQYLELSAPLVVNQVVGEEETIDLIPASISKPHEDLPSCNEEDVKVVSARSAGESSNHDFTLLGESENGATEYLSRKLEINTYLFDVMSGQSEVDHPLCEECTDTLLDQLDSQLKITEDECKDYKEFLEKLDREHDDIDEGALDRELLQLTAEETALQRQLEDLEAENAELQTQLEIEKQHSKQLDDNEDNYYKEYNEYKRQLLEYEDSQRSVDNQLRYAQTQLDKLKKTNVFNATFHIWHSGHFGTINNFRLGRLPSVPVEWNEINAAWGQTVLLLNALVRKMNLTLQRYRLVPYGSHSYIEALSDKSKELPLYGSGGFRFFWDSKFDQAMVAFLDCLQQFKEEVEKGDSGFCLPYKMDKGRIEDTSSAQSYSIKIQFNSEEQWTKALKFTLTNLKWGLAWVSSQFAN